MKIAFLTITCLLLYSIINAKDLKNSINADISTLKQNNKFRTSIKLKTLGSGNVNEGLVLDSVYLGKTEIKGVSIYPGSLLAPANPCENWSLKLKAPTNDNLNKFMIKNTDTDFCIPCRYLYSIKLSKNRDGSRVLEANLMNDIGEFSYIQFNLPYSKRGCLITDKEALDVIDSLYNCRDKTISKVDALKKLMNSKTAGIISLKSQISTQKDKCNSLKDSIKNKETEINSFTNKVKDIETLVSSIKNELNYNSDKLKENNQNIAKVNQELEDSINASEKLKESLKYLNQEIEEITASISDKNNQINENLKSSIDLVNMLEQVMAIPNSLSNDFKSALNDSNVALFEGKINSLEPRI